MPDSRCSACECVKFHAAPVPAAPAPEGIWTCPQHGTHMPSRCCEQASHTPFGDPPIRADSQSAPAPEATGEAEEICGATTGPLLPGVYDRVHTCTRPSGHFGRHWDGESGWGHVPTREEEQAWCDGMLVQRAAQAREIETLRADKARLDWFEWEHPRVGMGEQGESRLLSRSCTGELLASAPTFREAIDVARAALAARAPEPAP